MTHNNNNHNNDNNNNNNNNNDCGDCYKNMFINDGDTDNNDTNNANFTLRSDTMIIRKITMCIFIALTMLVSM